jgi:hypothetical protein
MLPTFCACLPLTHLPFIFICAVREQIAIKGRGDITFEVENVARLLGQLKATQKVWIKEERKHLNMAKRKPKASTVDTTDSSGASGVVDVSTKRLVV